MKASLKKSSINKISPSFSSIKVFKNTINTSPTKTISKKAISSTPFLQHAHLSLTSTTSYLEPKYSFLTSNAGKKTLVTSSWINAISSENSIPHQINQKENTNFVSTPIIILICGSIFFLLAILAFFSVSLIKKRKEENKYFELRAGLRNEMGERIYDENGKRIER